MPVKLANIRKYICLKFPPLCHKAKCSEMLGNVILRVRLKNILGDVIIDEFRPHYGFYILFFYKRLEEEGQLSRKVCVRDKLSIQIVFIWGE